MPAFTEELKRVPLFNGLSQRQLKALARDFHERTFRPGVTVVREGKMSGVDFFVLAEGQASVTVKGKKIDALGPGDYFGEMALIGRRERAATVTADTPLRCLSMKSWDFRRFVMANPDVSWKLLEHLVDLLNRG